MANNNSEFISGPTVLVVRRKLHLLTTLFLFLAVSTSLSQTVQTSSDHKASRPLHILVLGDSILWGQGLKQDHKTTYYVKLWLEKNTGRRVVERMEAHSGAVIERSSLTDNRTSANREVNVGLPTINDEVDSALSSYSDPSQVDLILISGCGNDLGIQNLLNASNVGEVDDMTEAKCGKPVETLLRRITTAFPAALVILTGYYPFFSDETRNDFVVKGLASRFFKTQTNNSRMSSKEVFERLKLNSKQWYQTSNNQLAEAARRINSETGAQSVIFAKVDFPSAYSFNAPKTHLWGFNRSPFRMALLILSFGKVLLPSNDEMRKHRTASCNEIYREQPNETIDQRKDRKALRLFCRYAALGHPNRKGALLYADAITNALKSTLLVTASNDVNR